MKYCPNCRTEYTDNTLQFCLQDGTRLTAVSDDPPTVAFGESETVVAKRGGERMRFDVQDSGAESFQTNRVTQIPVAPTETKKSNTALTILLTAFGMLILFGAIGIGAWLYLRNNRTEIAKNTNNAPNAANQTFDNNLPKNSDAKKSPTPKTQNNSTNANAFSSDNKPTPPPQIDRERIKTDISQSLDDWKSQSESLDLDAYMNSYADTVDYYRKPRASRAFVRSDKQRAFTKFDSIRFDLSNMSVTPDASGENATAVFDKEWEFSGAEGVSTGKVRQQLSFKKIGGKWLITGERDIKVY